MANQGELIEPSGTADGTSGRNLNQLLPQGSDDRNNINGGDISNIYDNKPITQRRTEAVDLKWETKSTRRTRREGGASVDTIHTYRIQLQKKVSVNNLIPLFPVTHQQTKVPLVHEQECRPQVTVGSRLVRFRSNG